MSWRVLCFQRENYLYLQSNETIHTHQQYDHREARKAQGNLMEKKQGNANEQKSIYYENLVREYEGDNERSYFYYKEE